VVLSVPPVKKGPRGGRERKTVSGRASLLSLRGIELLILVVFWGSVAKVGMFCLLSLTFSQRPVLNSPCLRRTFLCDVIGELDCRSSGLLGACPGGWGVYNPQLSIVPLVSFPLTEECGCVKNRFRGLVRRRPGDREGMMRSYAKLKKGMATIPLFTREKIKHPARLFELPSVGLEIKS